MRGQRIDEYGGGWSDSVGWQRSDDLPAAGSTAVFAVQGQGILSARDGFLKKIFLALFFIPAISIAGMFGSGSSVDYSRDAANTFYCANVVGSTVTTQAGLSVTGPALVLTNPYGSGKNLTLLDVGINVTASPAAASGFMLAYSTAAPQAIVFFDTNTVVIPALIPAVVNSSTTQVGLSKGQCYGGLGTVLPGKPVAFRYLGGTTGASAIGGVLLTDMTQGKVVIPPGSTISIQSTTAASINTHFLWREDNL